MVQFNLLPDVKLEFVKARRTKYMMTFVSVVVGAVALAVLLFALFYVNVVQRKSLNDLNKDIKSHSTELKNVEDLSKILTVQNQLNTLTSLHDKKPVSSRMFGYLTQLTPNQLSLTKLSVNFDESTMSISGTAPTLDPVYVFTDTLKSAQYTVEGSDTSSKPFSEVVLSEFGRDDKGASFTITLKFDPIIFDATKQTQLVVTQATTDGQTNLFTEAEQ